MDKKMGAESVQDRQARGGILSRESEKTLREAERYHNQGDYARAEPLVLRAIKEDEANMDAYCLLAAYRSDSPMRRDRTYETAERLGKQRLLEVLGPKAFDDDGPHVGNFWSILETRPYMRVLGSIRETAANDKKWAKASEVSIETLRLCPGDNMGVRSSLPTYLIAESRYLECLNFVFNWLLLPPTITNPPRGGTHLTSRSLADFNPSLTSKASAKTRRLIEENNDAEMAYSGARASWSLFGGECELSRVLLRSAVRLNGHVMRRVLGGVEQPEDVIRAPREMNSLEAAIDYLYLSQPYWLSPPALLDWISTDPVVLDLVLKNCSNPSCGKKEEKVCEYLGCVCKKATYCGKGCQLQHWKLPTEEGGHKEMCLKEQKWRKGMIGGFN